MSDPGGPGNPLQGLLGDLLKMIGGNQSGGTPWLDAARALAHGVATDGAPEDNPDPIDRIRLEELVRVAELHVAEATGLPVGTGDRTVSLVPATRGTWALQTLDSWAPLLGRMVDTQGRGADRGQTGDGEGPGSGSGDARTGLEGLRGLEGLEGLEGLGGPDGAGGLEGLGDLLGQFATTMGPVLLGMQFGSAAGHLSRRALGRYSLPIPWHGPDELLVVLGNVEAFAADWSLPLDQAQLWVCIRELTTHAVLSLPHVARHLDSLLEATAVDSVATQQGLAERVTEQAGDPESLQHLLSDPEALLSDLLTPGQRRTSAQLVAATTALAGYVDHMTARVAGSLVGSPASLAEAWRRYRTADAEGEQAAGSLFGLDLGREQVERGGAFVRGVVERAGDEGLSRLWTSARTLPTPAEVDAPGLWLERIDLPEGPGPEDGGTGPEDGGTGPGGGEPGR